MVAMTASPSSAAFSCGGGWGNKLIPSLFVVNIIIFTGAPTMTMRPKGDLSDATGVVATADAPDDGHWSIVVKGNERMPS